MLLSAGYALVSPYLLSILQIQCSNYTKVIVLIIAYHYVISYANTVVTVLVTIPPLQMFASSQNYSGTKSCLRNTMGLLRSSSRRSTIVTWWTGIEFSPLGGVSGEEVV